MISFSVFDLGGARTIEIFLSNQESKLIFWPLGKIDRWNGNLIAPVLWQAIIASIGKLPVL